LEKNIPSLFKGLSGFVEKSSNLLRNDLMTLKTYQHKKKMGNDA